MPLTGAGPKGCANAFHVAAKLSFPPAEIKDGEASLLAVGVDCDSHSDDAVKFGKTAELFEGQNWKNRANVTLSGGAAPFVKTGG